MILIEAVCKVVKLIARFFVWVITARDCYHCEHSYEASGGYLYCLKEDTSVLLSDCKKTITARNFEKRKGRNDD